MLMEHQEIGTLVACFIHNIFYSHCHLWRKGNLYKKPIQAANRKATPANNWGLQSWCKGHGYHIFASFTPCMPTWAFCKDATDVQTLKSIKLCFRGPFNSGYTMLTLWIGISCMSTPRPQSECTQCFSLHWEATVHPMEAVDWGTKAKPHSWLPLVGRWRLQTISSHRYIFSLGCYNYLLEGALYKHALVYIC